MFVLLLLIASWLLRACAPVDPLRNVALIEAERPPPAKSPPDVTPVLRASLDQTMADGKTLAVELAKLQAELNFKVASCKPAEPPAALPADRWTQKDLSVLQGCWVLGREARWTDTRSRRPGECTATAGRLCLDGAGNGPIEMQVRCPSPIGAYQCKAPAQAQFADDGTLRVQQPRGQCSSLTIWTSQSMVCKRVSDMQALCRSTSENGTTADVDFRRAP